MFFKYPYCLKPFHVTGNLSTLIACNNYILGLFWHANETIQPDFFTITNTEYTLDKVYWHYHENAYVIFILKGKLLKVSIKETYIMLLYQKAAGGKCLEFTGKQGMFLNRYCSGMWFF
jgi:hypothetical protein